MRIVPAIEAEIRRAIRDARALDPLINVSALQRTLEKKFQRTFARDYVGRLLHKVAREGLMEADRTQIEERLAQTRENYRLIRERLLKIVYWTPESAAKGIKPPFHAEIIDAAKTIVMLDLALLKAEIDNGLYRKPVEALAREIRYEPLPPEVRTVVIAAWQRGGLLPAAMVEGMVPMQPSRLEVGPVSQES
jgi:hypothetical protein